MTGPYPILHIYSLPWQPFTNFVDVGHRVRHKPMDTRFHCQECGDRRAAKNLEIQAYYDTAYIRCRGGKHPGWVG